jgi:TetR/AcrR family transcriptional repressor of mexJK operon
MQNAPDRYEETGMEEETLETDGPVAAKPGKEDRRDERRDFIVEIAKQAFVEFGYAGTSMSCIAARVGGSKGTLYNYFKSKEELFTAVVEKKCEQIRSLLSQAEIEAGGDLRAALMNFGEHFVELVLNDDSIATYRLAIGECARFPELGQTLYNSGVRQNQRRIGEFLEHAKQAGQLRPDADVMVAGEQFAELCLAGLHRRRLLNAIQKPAHEEIRSNVANAVSTFMRAFGG